MHTIHPAIISHDGLNPKLVRIVSEIYERYRRKGHTAPSFNGFDVVGPDVDVRVAEIADDALRAPYPPGGINRKFPF